MSTFPDGRPQRFSREALARVEGHGKVTLQLDEAGRVAEARLHATDFHGFGRLLVGRPYEELPALTERLCAGSAVSQHLCAAMALDGLAGGEPLTATAAKLRRVMKLGELIASHALHFFDLASAEHLFGGGARTRSGLVGVAADSPELARQGIWMRKFGQELLRATTGKRAFGRGAIAGGVDKALTRAERDALRADLPQLRRLIEGALERVRRITLEHAKLVRECASFPSNYVCLVAPDGALDLYGGRLRGVGADGHLLFDQVPVVDYRAHLAEEVRSWSYSKFPFLTALGPAAGWYRVGPLARLNAATYIGTPEAEAARVEFRAWTSGEPNPMSLCYPWARWIEALHGVELLGELLADPDLLGTALVAATGARRPEAVAAIETPRGLLLLHVAIDDEGLVTSADMIPPTASNNEAQNQAVRAVADQHLAEGGAVDAALWSKVEAVLAAYDPCIFCTVDAMGRAPETLELFDASGQRVCAVEAPL